MPRLPAWQRASDGLPFHLHFCKLQDEEDAELATIRIKRFCAPEFGFHIRDSQYEDTIRAVQAGKEFDPEQWQQAQEWFQRGDFILEWWDTLFVNCKGIVVGS
jgi:hypothetical protein